MAKPRSSVSKFKYAELLRKLSVFDNDEMPKINYDHKELMELAKDARLLLKKEPTLLELKPPLVVVGDTCGQFADLQRIFRLLGPKPGVSAVGKRRFLFLGDYVDSDSQSVECIFALLVLKLRYPNRFFLLRGDCETMSINKRNGFYDELIHRWGPEKGEALWVAINLVFIWLPLAAVVNNKILCVHGGIGPSLNSLDDIRNLKRPIIDPTYPTKNPVLCDLLWATPVIDLKGYMPNTECGVSVFFGEDTVIAACERFKVDLIVRSHQMMPNGYGFFCDRRLVSVFSAPRYVPETNNMGAVMTIDAHLKIGFKVLAPATMDRQGKDNFTEDFMRTANDDTVFYTTQTITNPNASTVVENTGQASAGTQPETKPTK